MLSELYAQQFVYQLKEVIMTKGIRSFTEKQFTKLLPRADYLGPTLFRRRVMEKAMNQFDISIASAATAYNFVLRKVRETDPEAVAMLGRQAADIAVPAKTAVSPTLVTLVKTKGGEVVMNGITKTDAKRVIAASVQRGHSPISIKETAEEAETA